MKWIAWEELRESKRKEIFTYYERGDERYWFADISGETERLSEEDFAEALEADGDCFVLVDSCGSTVALSFFYDHEERQRLSSVEIHQFLPGQAILKNVCDGLVQWCQQTGTKVLYMFRRLGVPTLVTPDRFGFSQGGTLLNHFSSDPTSGNLEMWYWVASEGHDELNSER